MRKIILGLAAAALSVGFALPAAAQPVVVVHPYHHYWRHHRPVVVVRRPGHWARICHWRHGFRHCERVWVR